MSTRRRRDGLARYFATGVDREVPHAEGECETCDEAYEITLDRMNADDVLRDTFRRVRMRRAARIGLPPVPVKGR